jgi:hypothetical protein
MGAPGGEGNADDPVVLPPVGLSARASAMRENFTDPARRAMLIALEEAERLGQDYLGTEHLLLGLVAEGRGLAAAVLKRLGIDEQRARIEFAKRLAPAAPGGVSPSKPAQTPRTKKAIEYAVEEARALDHAFLGTGHLLLGLLREREGVAAQMLAALGVGPEEVRQVVCESLRNGPEGTAEGPAPATGNGAEQAGAPAPEAASLYAAFTGQARRAVLLAHREAHRFGHDYVGTEHVLLGVLQENSGRVASLLQTFAVSVEAVRRELERSVRHGPEVPVGAKLPLTPPARRALQFAPEEARRLHHDRVGPEHLLLGVLHEPEGEASQVLLGLGLDLDRLREETLKLPPAEDHDAMLQPARAPGGALAQDPSAWELEWLVSADTPGPAAAAAQAPLKPSAEPILSTPSAAGLALQLRITQVVLGGLAGGLAGALLYGRPGGFLGVLAGVAVASTRSTALGVVVGILTGILVAVRHAPHNPGLQMLAFFVGGLVGCCLGDFLKGFSRERPPEDGGPRAGPG